MILPSLIIILRFKEEEKLVPRTSAENNKNAAKNIWLLVFPLLRGIRTFTLDFNAFYTWIKGAWFDILVILFILGFGYFRWLFTWFRFEKITFAL